MKKYFAVLILSALLLSSCAGLTPAEATPTPQPTPTTTPDPCSTENIVTEVEDLQALVNGFQATMVFANRIQDPAQVISPILHLQEIQLQIRRLNVPECLEKLKFLTLDYSDSVVNYLIFYLNQDISQEDFDTLVEISNNKWVSVVTEFNDIFSGIGSTSQEIPQFNPLVPETESHDTLILIEGPGTVNLYAAPNLDAEVLAALDSGSRAQVIGKTETGEWIQVDYDGTLGWVLAESVTVSVRVEDLPAIEAVP